jgi:hypothetical protein
LLIAPTSAELWAESTPESHVSGAENVSKLVSRDSLEDFDSRNRHTYSMELLAGKAHCARTATKQELESWPLKFDAKAAKTISWFYVPGYSKDRRMAFVSFKFTWSIHGAWAFYLLRKEGTSWEVVSTDLGFAV